MASKPLKRPREPKADHDLENIAPESKARKKSNPPKTKVPVKKPAIASTASVQATTRIPTPAPSSPASRDEPQPKPKPKPRAKPKPKPKTATPQKLYEAAIAKVEKVHTGLEKKCKKQNPNRPSITSDDFADVMTSYIPDVEKLLEMGSEGRKCAFDLMLHLGTCVHGDLDWGKMAGFGDHEEPYKTLDEAMLRVIQKRGEAGDVDDGNNCSVPTAEVPRRWTEADACVGPYKTGRPNKQQRGWLDAHCAAWNVERREKMRLRREEAGNWVTSALEELVEQRDYIKDYGLDGYFEESIKNLEELKSKET